MDNRDIHNRFPYQLMLREMQVMMQMDNFHNIEENLFEENMLFEKKSIEW